MEGYRLPGLISFGPNFIEPFPEELKCLRCCHVAISPQQFTCCGKLCCLSCFHGTQKRCPSCKKQNLVHVDQASDRAIKDLKVKCNNHQEGCEWTGELRDLQGHLTSCAEAKVYCDKCSAPLIRRNEQQHSDSECPCRLQKCQQCSQETTYEAIGSTHPDQCPMVEIPCPNEGCDFQDKRAVVTCHRALCPKERVQCDYAKVGCNAQVTRDSLEEHNTQYAEQHLKLTMDRIAAQRSISQIPPRVFKIQNFQHLKSTGSLWKSPTFYSHPGGYKMYVELTVHPQHIDDDEDDMSVHVYLVAGENDDNLAWPFRGKVTIQLLNQNADHHHDTKMVLFISSESEDYRKKPKNNVNIISTSASFTPDLEPANSVARYLKDDSIYIRISEVLDDNKPWLTPTD